MEGIDGKTMMNFIEFGGMIFSITRCVDSKMEKNYPMEKGKNDGKSPISMGKSTISMAIFNSYVKLLEGIQCCGNLKLENDDQAQEFAAWYPINRHGMPWHAMATGACPPGEEHRSDNRYKLGQSLMVNNG